MANYYRNHRSQGMHCDMSDRYKVSPATPPVSNTTQIHWGELPIAMGYVPCQKYSELFDLTKALHVGTVFPDLCKPFCGKGGGCR